MDSSATSSEANCPSDRQAERASGSKDRGLVIHTKRSVEAVFTKFDLDIVTADCVHERADGTDYYIYHVRKRG